MTFCFFGNYLKDYQRVVVLRQGIKANGIKILECHTRQRGLKKYFSLYQQHKKFKGKYDILLVAMGGQTLVWFAKILSNKKIVFDAFTSLYLTNVEDRKICSARSFKARQYWWWDWFSCKLADQVLLDTNAQISYFIEKFKINSSKFLRIFTSCDQLIYFPNKKSRLPRPDTGGQAKIKNQKFIIHWHGFIVPFYSFITIIKAAEKLKKYQDIEFRILTRFNSKYQKIQKLVEQLNLRNITFYPETNYQGVAEFINQADIYLGIFGNNKKAQVVIPNKIIEAIACKKAVITAEHRGLKELFIDKENIVMVKSEDPDDLAEKILKLKNNSNLKDKIEKNAYQLYSEKLNPKILVKELIKII